MTTDTALREAFDNLYRGNDGKNKTHRQISRAGFDAGWKACVAHLAQQPVAPLEKCPRCDGSGKVEAFRYKNPPAIVMNLCTICKGSGFLSTASQPDTSRDDRQRTVSDWCRNAFGDRQASSLPQRGIRLLEEAIEAAQAAGCERDMSHKLVDFIFDRPAGELKQELGGIGVTVLALAAAANLSADDCETREIERVLSKPLTHFSQRNQAKNDAGFEASQKGA